MMWLSDRTYFRLLILVAVMAIAGLFYFFRTFLSTRDVQAEMARKLQASEWWATVNGSRVETARLHAFRDGSCQVQHGDDSYSFTSYARAERRLREDGYELVSKLMSEGKLSADFVDRLEHSCS
jgi:hypothetical protein